MYSPISVSETERWLYLTMTLPNYWNAKSVKMNCKLLHFWLACYLPCSFPKDK